MIVGAKSGVKLIGISIVACCAVFVCTFFSNYYIDVQNVAQSVDASVKALFDAQVLIAKITCAVTGGVLGTLTAGMLAFYIKLYIDGEAKRLGMLKAMGYSDTELALKFWVFGLSVLIGTSIGYGAGAAVMPYIYREMALDGMPAVAVNFHAELFVSLVFAPPVVFGGLACAFAAIALRKSPSEMLRGAMRNGGKPKACGKLNDKSFITEMRGATLRGKKSAVFFVAFACFCFSAMVQMGASMFDYGGASMSLMILLIGVVLSVVALIMAITTVVNGNKRNIAVMKAFGYGGKERAAAILVGYVPFALIGYGLGTVYQYGFLKIMINIVFAGVENVPTYTFDATVFFIALIAFAICYVAAMLYYARRINNVSVKCAMADE